MISLKKSQNKTCKVQTFVWLPIPTRGSPRCKKIAARHLQFIHFSVRLRVGRSMPCLEKVLDHLKSFPSFRVTMVAFWQLLWPVFSILVWGSFVGRFSVVSYVFHFSNDGFNVHYWVDDHENPALNFSTTLSLTCMVSSLVLMTRLFTNKPQRPSQNRWIHTVFIECNSI